MAPTTLRIALDWTPNTIHAGLYLALAKGYYAAHSLSVKLLPPDAQYSTTPAKRLQTGEADLAICPSESCIAYNESGNLRLQAIYAILQKDASAIAGTKLGSMRELGTGRTYGSYNARYEDAIVQAMVAKDGGDAQGMSIEREQGKLSMFQAVREGRLDATWIFVPWEGVEAEMEGAEIKCFTLEDYGIPYGYSPVIARNADTSPSDEVLAAFVAATREGYEHAIKNPHDAADVLREHCVPERSMDFLRRSQESINDYYTDGHKPGYMDPAKWNTWLMWLRVQMLLVGPQEIKEEHVFTNQFVR